jgi:hypothetical protein
MKMTLMLCASRIETHSASERWFIDAPAIS